MNRVNPGERAKTIKIEFSNGSHEIHHVRNSPLEVFFKVNPTTTTSVRFTIDAVFSTINNGGAFNIYGVPCIEPEGVVADK